jgi:Kef-type K+ transport system membrane component KefB
MTHSLAASEALLFSVLVQIIVMIAAARVAHSVARNLGQPGVIGEIVAGLALGPSLVGHFFPGWSATVFGHAASPPIVIISQIGLILLMFQIGTAFEFGLLRDARHRAAAGWVALASVSVPFCLGVGFGVVSAPALAPHRDVAAYSLFCGVAVAITAVPILGRILAEFGLARTPVGVIAISAAAVNDVAGWLLLACISAYATASLTAGFVWWRAGALVVGAVLLWFAGRPGAAWLLRSFPVRQGVLAPNLMAIVLCLMFALGLATNGIGIFTIFGGFAAGLLFHRNADFVRAWRVQVGEFVAVFFLPVFFTYTGLRTNLLGLTAASDWGWLVAVVVLSVLGKVLPVYGVGRARGFGHWQSVLLGTLMNTRALMELIVLNIGLDLGVLPQKVFTMLVTMAVVTTVMTGPLLRIALKKECSF